MRITNCNSIMAMKTKCGFAVFFSVVLFFACSGGAAAQDGNGFEGARHKTVRTMYGFGRQDVLDTYLSPLIYKGFDLRFVRDIRRSAARNGRIMLDNSFDIDASMPENKSGYREYALLFNWNYAVRYELLNRNGWRVECGGASDLAVGGLYNPHNGNNPASARASYSVDASFLAGYSFSIRQRRIDLEYKLDVPLLGAVFSPVYGLSYYEMFEKGSRDGVVRFASLHNRPSMKNRITADVRFDFLTLSFGYMWDVNQTSVNNLKTHYYTQSFLIGFKKYIWTR